MNPTTLLLLLPGDAYTAAPWLRIDPAGHVLERGLATPEHPMPASPTGSRHVLAVPGAATSMHWLQLPARNPVQALAAARLLLADDIAGAHDGLHLAVGAAVGEAPLRPVALIDAACMQACLDRATALGMTADIAVPTPLLLPAADADADADAAPPRLAVAGFDGQWLVRGPQLAFAAEPELAAQIIGARPIERYPDAPGAMAAGLAAGADALPLDLLQYRFARTPERPAGWAAWRLPAMLAAALLASPLVLLATQWGWYAYSARGLEAESRAEVTRFVPTLAAADDPLLVMRERLASHGAGDRFALVTGALLAAVEATPGVSLDALEYAGGELHATIVHTAPDALAGIRTHLADAGFELAETGTRAGEGRIHTEVGVRVAHDPEPA